MTYAEENCRAFLGVERFGEVTAELQRLPPTVDRAAVLDAIAEAVAAEIAFGQADPNFARDLEERLDAIGRAIEKLKRLRPPGPGAESGEPLPDFLADDWLGSAMEREYLSLRRALLQLWYPLTGRDDLADDWNGSLVAEGRDDLIRPSKKRPKGGGPRTPWRQDTRRRLEGLGVSPECADLLLRAAGLVAPRKPTRKT